MDTINSLLEGFAVILAPEYLLAALIGATVGTITGILPGLGAVGAISLLLPLSFGMDATAAVIMFTAIYYGVMYGGSTTSILVNVPGDGASLVTLFEGHPMAKKGKAGVALGMTTLTSLFGGLVGLIGLIFAAPLLANAALAFGSPEYFAIAFFGLVLLSNLTGTSALKSGLMVFVGMMFSTIGMDPIAGINRFTFDINVLQRGVEFVIIGMGVYGLGEMLRVISSRVPSKPVHKVGFLDVYPKKQDIKRSTGPAVRGSILGFLLGLIPGPSTHLATFSSYGLEKKISKYKHEFGHGAIEGIAGPEAGNNSAAAATMIPLLSLGLPFSSAAAVILSGFMIHGITPGPTLISAHPDVFWGLIASMFIGNLMLLIINLPLIPMFASVLRTPIHILVPIVAVLVFTGAYAINNSISDLVWLLFFGILGYFMKMADFEAAPLVLGFFLGPIAEKSFIQSLAITDGSIVALFTRPLSGTLLGLAFIFILFMIIRWIIGVIKKPSLKGGR